MRCAKRNTILLLALLLTFAAWTSAQDEAPYYQSADFNVPIIAGWQNQSANEAAQFHKPAASATIRAAMATGADAEAAAAADLASWLGLAELTAPVYRGKVNLADGTWHVLARDIDAQRSVSQVARQAGDRFIVISFLESDPSSRIVMLAIAQADETLETAEPEMDSALEQLTGLRLDNLTAAQARALPGGEWLVYQSETALVAGSLFGNDSYIALQEGTAGDLAALADAWRGTLLGFFITPDNSPYLWLGITVSLLILAALAGSFAWRARALQKDLAMIEQLEKADAR